MGPRPDLAAPVSHIWFFKGVPSRIGYPARHGSQGTGGRSWYFAASIITWVDEEARAPRISTRSRRRSTRSSTPTPPSVRSACSNCASRSSVAKKHLQTGKTDELHRRGPPVGRIRWTSTWRKILRRGAREAGQGNSTRRFDADIADTEAYIEDAAEADAQRVGALQDDGGPSRSSTTRRPSASSRSASAPPTASANTSVAAMGAEGDPATCSSRSTWTPKRTELEDQVKDRQRPEAGPRGQAPEGGLRLQSSPATSREMMVLDAVPGDPAGAAPDGAGSTVGASPRSGTSTTSTRRVIQPQQTASSGCSTSARRRSSSTTRKRMPPGRAVDAAGSTTAVAGRPVQPARANRPA